MLKILRCKKVARVMVFAILLTVIAWLTPSNLSQVSAATTLKNPRVTGDQMMTWDCVYFGSYPQSEIYESDIVYEDLKRATWDQNDDVTIGEVKYHRIQETYYDDSNNSQNPILLKVWRYFKYEPIKWRILSVNESENKALLLSDKNLDMKAYNEENIDVTWKTSTIRSWLNGYGRSSNYCNTDYTTDNFINTAFTTEEQDIIQTSTIKTPANLWHGTSGGEDAEDRIFLLSIDEAMEESYGFLNTTGTTETRESMNTAYVASYPYCYDEGTSDFWWLRTVGDDYPYATSVYDHGMIDYDGIVADSDQYVVRPALYLDLSTDTLYSYAGTVSADMEKVAATGVVLTPSAKSLNIGETFTINAEIQPSNATNKSINWESDNTSIATVTDHGVVTAVGIGKTEIYAITEDFGYYSICTINVTNKPPTTNPPVINPPQTPVPGSKEELKSQPAPSTETKSTVAKPKKVTLKKTSSPKKKSLKVTWKRDSKATGYQAVIATDKKFKKNKKTSTITKNKTTSKTFTKLKSKKTYLVKVRAYKKYGNKKVYGAYSKVKKVKVK